MNQAVQGGPDLASLRKWFVADGRAQKASITWPWQQLLPGAIENDRYYSLGIYFYLSKQSLSLSPTSFHFFRFNWFSAQGIEAALQVHESCETMQVHF